MSKLNMNLLKFGTIGMLFEPKDSPDWVRVCFVRLDKEGGITETIEDFYYDTAVGEMRHIKTGTGTETTDIDANLKICRDGYYYTFQFCEGSRYYYKKKSALFELNYSVDVNLDNAWNISWIDDWLNKYSGYGCIGNDTDGLEVGAIENVNNTRGKNFQQFQYCFDINPGKEDSTKAKFTIDNGTSGKCIIDDTLSKGHRDKKGTKDCIIYPKILDFDGWLDFPEKESPYFKGNLVLPGDEGTIIGNLMLQIQIE